MKDWLWAACTAVPDHALSEGLDLEWTPGTRLHLYPQGFEEKIIAKNAAQIAVSVLLAGWVTLILAAGPSYQIQVDGLACPFCAYGIEKELNRIENVENVETHLADGVVIVTMREGASLDEETANRAVEKAGFTPRGFAQTGPEQDDG